MIILLLTACVAAVAVAVICSTAAAEVRGLLLRAIGVLGVIAVSAASLWALSERAEVEDVRADASDVGNENADIIPDEISLEAADPRRVEENADSAIDEPTDLTDFPLVFNCGPLSNEFLARVSEDEPETDDASADPMGNPPGSKATVNELADENETEPASDDPLRIESRYYILHEERRPVWVEQEAQWKGDHVHTSWVTSDPWKTRFECDQALDQKLVATATDYVAWYIGRNDAAKMIGLDLNYIKQHGLIQHTYGEDLQFSDPSIGAMKQVHVLLGFDQSFRNQLAEEWKEQVVSARLLQLGLVAAGVLGLVFIAFSYLKYDGVTRGYQTGRLRTVALGMIIWLVVAGVLIARWIPWL